MACKLDNHPIVYEIDKMLKDGLDYPTILEFVVRHTPEFPVTKPQLSRHAIGDLKLDPRGPRKKQKMEVQDMPEVPGGLEGMVSESMKIAYWRMINKPEDISTPALFTFLTQAMKMLEQGKDKGTDLTRKLGQINDANTSEQSQDS